MQPEWIIKFLEAMPTLQLETHYGGWYEPRFSFIHRRYWRIDSLPGVFRYDRDGDEVARKETGRLGDGETRGRSQQEVKQVANTDNPHRD